MAKSYGYYRRDSDATLWNRFDTLVSRQRMTRSAGILAAVREWVARNENKPLPEVPAPKVPGSARPSGYARAGTLPEGTPDPFAQ